MKISIQDGIYVEDRHKIPKVRLDDRDYQKAVSAMIGVCADAIIIDMGKRLFYLPRRTVKPMKGYWSIGGRRFPGESASKAVSRNFERETTVKVAPSRFHPVSTVEVIWKDRKEPPTTIGKHDLIQFFTVVLGKKEFEKASGNLCKDEYETGSLEPFDRKKMALRKLHPVLIDIYDRVFPHKR